MLSAMPIVLACYAIQPCQPAAIPNPLIRSSSPAAIVTVAPREDLTTGASQALRVALRRARIPSLSTPSYARRTQIGLPSSAASKTTKGVLILAGVIAGCYAGGHLGAAMDDSPDDGAAFVGMPIGAALGGWIVWNLVR